MSHKLILKKTSFYCALWSYFIKLNFQFYFSQQLCEVDIIIDILRGENLDSRVLNEFPKVT